MLPFQPILEHAVKKILSRPDDALGWLYEAMIQLCDLVRVINDCYDSIDEEIGDWQVKIVANEA